MIYWSWSALIEIPLLAVAIYFVLRFMKGTRGLGILKGVASIFCVVIVAMLFVTRMAGLTVITWVIEGFLPWSLVALVVILQPEVRRALVRLGQNPFIARFSREAAHNLNEIVRAVAALAKTRTGALIAIQREVGMRSFIEGGTRLDAELSQDLLTTIFRPGTTLHDGAVIIRGDRIVAAGCLFPLTENTEAASGLGTRHRAAIGVTEETDAIAIVVSEETGQVSVAVQGQLTKDVDTKGLRKILQQLHVQRLIFAEPEVSES